MTLRVDPDSPEPPFAQLHAQVTAQVAGGSLRPGDRLPPVRRLAEELGIAPNTVARAYRELEADGVLVGRGRAGTFVAAPAGRGEEARAAAEAAAATYARTVRDLGLDVDAALALVRRSMRG
ncbi:GntR family transcriptional regulator [Georgenia wutianyii]|uniref:GntR family transcriptional regulator n=1 Tax=Georgenia wutianyii TaxID=2585135 RepID=A0ABX5VMJ4_9MICO|nr:GntR family transcriptional regulator [Georgenia wutianyii]QDB79714.1 GntR family transcriptional regulator [Georgenia wutianyii]